MITWSTDVNAPCCPGEIVNDDGRTLLIQTDWDYPGTAQSFGWSTRNVQRCPECGRACAVLPLDELPNDKTRMIPVYFACPDHDNPTIRPCCEHDGTDGTVDCACGVTAADFIAAAYDWLRDNDGATAEDPGYFG